MKEMNRKKLNDGLTSFFRLVTDPKMINTQTTIDAEEEKRANGKSVFFLG